MKQNHKLILGLAMIGCVAMPNLFAAETVKVDLTDSIRPVTHCASGALYGVTEEYPRDIAGMIGPLKCNMFCQPGEGKNGNQHAFGDALEVAKRLQGTTATVQITLADILPYWPYKWPGQQEWLQAVERVVKRKLESGLDNIDSYVIWNEPYGTWNDSNGEFHATVWKPTYELLRRLDPTTKIVGPAIAYYTQERMERFLKFCIENNCMPDVICWHQWGSGGFVGAVENLRYLEKKYNLPEHTLCINEYCAGSSAETQKYEGCPGYSVPFIAKFERNNVESATISWWFTNLPGRLGSLLTANNEKGGGWWLYKWYGDMAGYMARVTPPNDKSEGVDGFAAVDRKQNCASIVIGGKTTGTVDVKIEKLPQFLNGKVNVKIERVTWENKDKAVAGTDLVSEKEMAVSGSGLTIPVNVESELYAYRIYLTPLDVPQIPYKNQKVMISKSGVVEAENYDEAGQGFSYYDNDLENKGGEYRDDGVDIVKIEDGYAVGYTENGEWLEYTINFEEAGEYAVSANVSNAGEVEGFQLYIDNQLMTNEYSIPQTCEDWSVYEEVMLPSMTIEKGDHVLKLLIVGSYINIDWLKFELKGLSKVNEVSNSANLKDAHYYNINGQMVGKDDLQNDRLYMIVTSDKKGNQKIIKSKR